MALAAFEEITDEEIDRALATAESCFQDWCRKSPGERAAIISKAAEILRAREDEFAASATLGIDILFDQARREMALAADVIEYFAKNAHSRIYPNLNAGFAESDHFGIIFGAQPDSYPYFQLARLTASNLMAGNVVIIKHAGIIPPCAVAFERLWLEAGAPAGAFTNLLVSQKQAEWIVDDPRIKCASNGGVKFADRVTRRTRAVLPTDSKTARGLRETAPMRGGPLL